MEAEKVVGIWVRVSTDMQGDSPEHHQKRGELYAEAKNWKVGEVYLLEAVSGKSVIDHPEYKRMAADIKRGHISALIFSKLARVARNIRELLDFSDYFKLYNADMVSLGESLDTSTPMGRFFYTLIAAVAQWEREEISSRVAASVPIRATLGKSTGGAAMFGYKWENQQLAIDETEAPIRRQMYEIFSRVRRKKATASELNALGYRTRSGSQFTGASIERLIRDSTAKGIRRANYTKSRGNKKHWDLKPTDEWVLVACPPIVSVELWEECNRILDAIYRKQEKPGRLSKYLLGGMVKCACGNKMHVFHKNLIYTCRKCKNRVDVADIDHIYHTRLKTFLLTDTDSAQYQQQSEQAIEEKTALLNTTTRTIQQLEQEMRELVTMRVQKELTPEDFTAHYQPLKDRHTDLQPTLMQLQSEIDVLKIHALSSDTILHEANDLYTRWEELPFEDKRMIVETITDHIIVGQEEVSVKLSHLPSPHPSSQNGVTREHNFKG